MHKKAQIFGIILLFLTFNVASIAQTTLNEFEAVIKCQNITDNNARLACYDKNIQNLTNAQSTGDLIVIDKESADNIERDSFGFNIPSIDGLRTIFQRNKKPKLAIKDPLSDKPLASNDVTRSTDIKPPAQDTNISSVQQAQNTKNLVKKPTLGKRLKSASFTLERVKEIGPNRYKFYFTNGQVWEQTERTGGRRIRLPKGKTLDAEISRGALGGYIIYIKRRGLRVKVKRVR